MDLGGMAFCPGCRALVLPAQIRARLELLEAMRNEPEAQTEARRLG